MASNKSDYNKPFTNIFELLPNVFQSDINKALAENAFNRFLSKTEVQDVVGVIGEVTSGRQIPEVDVHRQAHQLQPVIINKIATVEHIASFKDVMRESARLGVNYSRFNEWGNSRQFNFVPPIDIDKIVNYSDYYWLNDTKPQYVTIANRARQLRTVLEQVYRDNPLLKKLVEQYMTAEDDEYKAEIAESIENIYPGLLAIVDEHIYFFKNDPINRVSEYGWEAIIWDAEVAGGYDIPLDGLNLKSVTTNAFTVSGDYTRVFNYVPMFAFQVLESTNNDGLYQVLTAMYDSETDTTEITVVGGGINPLIADGFIDISFYDLETYDHYSEGKWDEDAPTDGSSDVIEANPNGYKLQSDPWSATNYWVHISDIPGSINISQIQRAEQPIIEYAPFIQLNEWSYTEHQWYYRATRPENFSFNVGKPSNDELFATDQRMYLTSLIDRSKNQIGIDFTRFPKAIDDLKVDGEITIEYLDTQQFTYHKVASSELVGARIIAELDSPILEGNIRVHGIRYTSQGDDWIGFFNHWVYVGKQHPVPVDVQTLNPNLIDGDDNYLNQTEILEATGLSTYWYKLNDLDYAPGRDEIRVYFNGVRQYGTYQEAYFDGVNYTIDIPEGLRGNAIKLRNPLGRGEIRVDVGPAAASDIGRDRVRVRTTTDEGYQAEYVSLIEYRLAEQHKYQDNQYPLFDVFNLDGTSAYKAGPLWKFLESPSYPVNERINRRVVVDKNVYSYEQQLLESDNGRMYAYKEKIVDGEAYELRTIWRRGLNNEEYVPRFVNAQREVVAIGDASGDWEIPQQMQYNLEHENRRILTGVDLQQHFKSIIESQENPNGYADDAKARWRILLQPNYALGGQIKEFNDGFDTFLSSTFVNNVTVPSLIEFVANRYDGQLSIVRDLFEQNIRDILDSSDDEFFFDFQAGVSDLIINKFESNDARDGVFGDSTTYDADRGVGVRNWVATLPFVKLTNAQQPAMFVDSKLGIIEVRHHDGHVSSPSVNGKVFTALVDALKRDSVATVGNLADRPAIGSLPKGFLFYAADTKQLFRYNVGRSGNVTPVGLPEGAYWYDTTASKLKQLVNGAYVVVDNSNAWLDVNLSKIYAGIVLEIEKRLYEAAPKGELNYDISQVMSDVEFTHNEKKQFVKFTKDYKVANPKMTDYSPSNAFTWNYGSVNINAYSSVVETVPAVWADKAPSRWYDIYEGIYGTRYPHLEPWKLQGFANEPEWWAGEYAGTDRRWTTGMWDNIKAGVIPAQYEQPVETISRYYKIPVIMGDQQTTDGLYQPDDLLPPYYNAVDAEVVAGSCILTIAPQLSEADNEYEFGANGPIEDTWRRSIAYTFDLAEIAFITQPVRFVHRALGNDLAEIDGLLIDKSLNKVFSHRDTKFHGDIVNGKPLVVHGINQWYTNFLRYHTYDSEVSDFKTLWTGWRPKLAYQTGSFVIPEAVAVNTGSYYLDESDYEIVTKRTPGMRDFYVDSLQVVVSKSGVGTSSTGIKIPVGAGSDWQFRITTPNPSTSSLRLYGVKSEVVSGFRAIGGSNTSQIWNHHAIDKDVVLEFTPGDEVGDLGPEYSGVQGLVNFIDGYAAYTEEVGFDFNDIEINDIDSDTGRTVTWQLEIERLINQVYIGMSSDQQPVEFRGPWNTVYVDINTNRFLVAGSNPLALQNDAIVQIASTGSVPAPFKQTRSYYVVNVSLDSFQLAEQMGGAPIEIANAGHGLLSVGMYRFDVASPATYHEVNPFRNAVMIKHDIGIVANLHNGPFRDIRIQQGIYDQYGRPLSDEQVKIYRSDRRSKVSIDRNIVNDVVDNQTNYDARNNIHIGGMHVFVDGYEHAIVFNRKTSAGSLLFDQFLGSAIRVLGLNLRTQQEKTFRPNAGGYYLSDGQLKQNIEGSAENLQHMYDAHLSDMNSAAVQSALSMIGFERKDYMDSMGVTPKSQLQFHRGVIQYKGSTNAVKAFINSKHFLDAKVDEYWAYKVTEYGEDRAKVYPELKLNPNDTRLDTLSLQFPIAGDRLIPNYINVTLDDKDRWYDHPNQLREVFDGEPNLYFEADVVDIVEVDGDTLMSSEGGLDGYLHLTTDCDFVRLVAEQPPQTMRFVAEADHPNHISGFRFISQANSVEIYARKQNADTFVRQSDYTEMTSMIVLNSIVDEAGVEHDVEAGDMISVTIKNATLVEGIHYTRLNNRLVRVDANAIDYDPAEVEKFVAYCMNPAKTKLNPIKLIDYKSGVSIKNIPVWDPARGHHYHIAQHIVNYGLASNVDADPAFYTNHITGTRVDRNKAWTGDKVGQVWWDKANLAYKPYNDRSIIASAEDRVREWGTLADWGRIELYEWVESPVPPAEYEQYVADQIKNGVFISGTPKKALYKRTRDVETSLWNDNWVEVADVRNSYTVATDLVQTTEVVETYDIVDPAKRTTVTDLYGFISVDLESEYVVYLNGSKFTNFEVVENGIRFHISNNVTVDISGQVISNNTTTYRKGGDVIVVEYPVRVPSEEELEFDPTVKEDITVNVQYRYDYRYTQTIRIADNGVDVVPTYYFWVRDTSTKHGVLTLRAAEQQLEYNPAPFVIFQNPLTSEKIDGYKQLPDRYNQAVIRGLINTVSEADRYKLRFTKDFTLRDDFEDTKEGSLKSRHTDWRLIRERQKFNIERRLWNKLMETLSGRTQVEDGEVPTPIPALNRVLFDETNGTSYRFGLREGQAMADRERAIAAVVDAINDPSYDLFPIDREEYLSMYSFDTPDNIELALEAIYNTFLPQHVNRIWFAVLYEGMADNVKYNDIFKTSWIQLDGIRLLDTSGALS